MEKLIELLNEYEKESWLDLSRYSYTDNEYDLELKLDKLSELKPFIRRLVENDKIKVGNIPEFYHVSDHCFNCIYEWVTDNTIMLLSIQKDLIDYLQSILK